MTPQTKKIACTAVLGFVVGVIVTLKIMKIKQALLANTGSLYQTIDHFGSGGSGTCISGTWVYYSFPLYPPNPGTTKVSIDTFDTRNGQYDTAVRVVQRSPLTNLCCNDNSPIAPTFNPKLSQCTNVMTQATSYYQFLIYVNENAGNPIPPPGTVFYLNYKWY